MVDDESSSQAQLGAAANPFSIDRLRSDINDNLSRKLVYGILRPSGLL